LEYGGLQVNCRLLHSAVAQGICRWSTLSVIWSLLVATFDGFVTVVSAKPASSFASARD
jgi:hypothetical protein